MSIYLWFYFFLNILDKDQIESHRYYGQVRMDVERTLKRFPPSRNFWNENNFIVFFFKDYSYSERIELQEELIVAIVKILIKHDYLNYYQVNYLKIRK